MPENTETSLSGLFWAARSEPQPIAAENGEPASGCGCGSSAPKPKHEHHHHHDHGHEHKHEHEHKSQSCCGPTAETTDEVEI